jgi:hypothetical protein
VDEFQNFATDSFATILSEARKYGLNLTVANQYISQMSDTVRGAVFGNVGTMICFRVSADDSPILSKQFEPNFEALDLLQMHNRNFVINMVINGEKTPAFSSRTLNLPVAQADNSEAIIENTRRKYSRTRAEVQAEISDLIEPKNSAQGPVAAPPQPKVTTWPINAQTQVVTPDSQRQPEQRPQQSQQQGNPVLRNVLIGAGLIGAGYLLGRLFATYEHVQTAALGRSLNSTIRDKFYGAASATPRKVFTLLDKGSTNHLSKLAKDKKGYAVVLERQIAGIMEQLDPSADPFPAFLTSDQQSLFAIGYYHQKYHRKDVGASNAPAEEMPT